MCATFPLERAPPARPFAHHRCRLHSAQRHTCAHTSARQIPRPHAIREDLQIAYGAPNDDPLPDIADVCAAPGCPRHCCCLLPASAFIPKTMDLLVRDSVHLSTKSD